jgi:hypothetical protein
VALAAVEMVVQLLLLETEPLTQVVEAAGHRHHIQHLVQAVQVS